MERELLPKDLLVALESKPERLDEMLDTIKDDSQSLPWSAPQFLTATAVASPFTSDLHNALRNMERMRDQEAWHRQQSALANQQYMGGLTSNGSTLGNLLNNPFL